MNSKTLLLYSGDGCHLCDQAKDIVFQVLPADWRLEEISIRGVPELEARYGVRIPVIAIAGGEEKGWPFTAGQVRKMVGMSEA
ncbi:MAG: hypothetical protein VR73_05585 [Gammaproteobacteria bacterium BRH_c0]|nr:MAG: hypothetical protein VR73_05585 [Gammaproteobacteria bacterium BRH_c0]